MTISSDKVFNSLERFGIDLRKTFIQTFPEWLIEHPLVHHFMRGIVDGDGSFFFPNQKGRSKPQLYFNVRGTQKFLMAYRSILERHTTVRKRGDKPIRINNNMGMLEYGGNGIMMSIREFLYKDATVYLQRKYDKAYHEDVRAWPKMGGKVHIGKKFPNRWRTPVIAINLETGEETRFSGQVEAVEKLGVTRSGIGDCIKGRQRTHRGYTFRKVEE